MYLNVEIGIGAAKSHFRGYNVCFKFSAQWILWPCLFCYRDPVPTSNNLEDSIIDFENLKGQCHEIFRFWFFSISFPPAPEYPIRTVSNFFENSWRYSRLKVDHRCRWHRWQMRKIFNQKNFNNFVGTPLDSRVLELTHVYIFAFKFTLRYLQPDINPFVCHRCRWHRWQICHRYQQH